VFELSVRCPHCHESFLDYDLVIDEEPSILLRLRKGQTDGWIRLSSVYGSDNYETNIELADQEVVAFYCPVCNQSLATVKECRACGAPVAQLDLAEGGSVKLCTRKGCKRNVITFSDPRGLAIQKLVPRDCVAIPDHAPLTDAVKIMISEEVSVVPVVVGHSLDFAGLLLLDQALQVLFNEGREEFGIKAISDLTIQQCPIVPPGTTLEAAARSAAEQLASHIAVCQQRKLLGLVPAAAIYRLLADYAMTPNGFKSRDDKETFQRRSGLRTFE